LLELTGSLLGLPQLHAHLLQALAAVLRLGLNLLRFALGFFQLRLDGPCPIPLFPSLGLGALGRPMGLLASLVQLRTQLRDLITDLLCFANRSLCGLSGLLLGQLKTESGFFCLLPEGWNFLQAGLGFLQICPNARQSLFCPVRRRGLGFKTRL
jgi:hypothetical protein